MSKAIEKGMDEIPVYCVDTDIKSKAIRKALKIVEQETEKKWKLKLMNYGDKINSLKANLKESKKEVFEDILDKTNYEYNEDWFAIHKDDFKALAKKHGVDLK